MKSGSYPSSGVMQDPLARSVSRGAESSADVDRQPLRACFGVACPVRGRCARYAAVGNAPADPQTMVTCQRGADFPLFAQVVDEVPVTQASRAGARVGQRTR